MSEDACFNNRPLSPGYQSVCVWAKLAQPSLRAAHRRLHHDVVSNIRLSDTLSPRKIIETWLWRKCRNWVINLSGLFWLRDWNQQQGLGEEAASSTFSEAHSLWEQMTAAPSWAYRSPYTHRLSSALMIDTHPTHKHSCFHRSSRALQILDTHTHAPLPPSSTWINSPAAPENAAPMMSPAIPSLQRHKSTSCPSAKSTNAPSHFSLCPPVS